MNEKVKVFFVTGKIAFFEKFVSNDFLCPKEKNLLLEQKVSKDLLDPYKVFLDIYHVRY